DNAPVIKEIQALRHERATMLDYPHYSDYAMEGMMPEDVKTVHRFLEKVGEGALDKFSDTMGKISAYAKSQDGPEKLEPWDVAYWGGKYKEEAFGFDAQKFSEYLPLEQSIDGFFNTAERIFGITFEERDDLPLYHPDVRTFEVKNTQTGESHGFLYADMYAREGKTGGAWMSSLQSPEEGKPNIVTLNMNLMKPSEGQTAQLSLRDLETLFHEGGHAIHGLLGTDTRHPSLVGTASSSDYVEFFSTVLENWPNQEACLKTFARHHKTGEAIPDELIQSWKDSSEFLSEAPALKLVQNSLRDLLFHSSDPKEYTTSKAIEDKADFDHPLADHICAYPLQRWGHLFSSPQSGYASGYFGYLWSESLAKIGFKPFEKNGIYDPETCENLASIYRKGGSWDQTKAYEAFHGGKVTPEEMADAVLESIGASKRLTRNNAQTQSR
ncbi:MAG: M3 family metallopeptidase, partial [Rickettsiales bacterium]